MLSICRKHRLIIRQKVNFRWEKTEKNLIKHIAPLYTVLLVRRSVKDGCGSDNMMLFFCGNAVSGALCISGTNQFPKPPIMLLL